MMLRRGCVMASSSRTILLDENLHERVVMPVCRGVRCPSRRRYARESPVREEERTGTGEPHAGERRGHTGQCRITAHVGGEVPVGGADADGELGGIRHRRPAGDETVHERRGGEITGRAVADTVRDTRSTPRPRSGGDP